MRLSKQNLAELKQSGLSAKLSPPAARKRRNNEESRSQQKVISWWRGYSKERNIPECLLFAIPNGSALGHGKEEYQVRQRQIRGKIMKAEGLRPGVFDLFLSVPSGLFHGMYIDMKAENGALSDEQKAFLSSVQLRGYLATVCNSAESAINLIQWYLNL